MSCLLVDAAELNTRHVVVFADFDGRGCQCFGKLVVKYEAKLYVDVSFLHIINHICHGRTELIEVFFLPIVVQEFSHWRVGP